MQNFIWVSSTMPQIWKNWWSNSKKTHGQNEGGGGRVKPYLTGPFVYRGGGPWQSCKPHHFSLRIIVTFHIFPNTSSILTQHVAPMWCRENKLGNNTSHIASYHGMHKAWREMKQCFKCYAFAKMLSLLICIICIEQVFCQQWIRKIILISSLILLHLFEDIKWKW